MNPKYVLLIISCFVLLSCENNLEEDLKFTDFITKVDFSGGKMLHADGTSMNEVTVSFNKKAALSKIIATASITNGSFNDNGKSEYTLEPERLNANEIITATFKLKGTTINAGHTLSFNVNSFVDEIELESIKSIPSSIALSVTSVSAIHNFVGQVPFSALLSNDSGRKVSNGVMVQVRDVLDDGNPANGIFINPQFSSNGESSISGVYSPGTISPNQFVTIIVDILNPDGTVSSLSDQKKIFILPL